jgi:hypothetical protein|nr:MAG TPA: SH3 domain of SH3b2 type [Caudoviricetes sp.]
MIELGIFIACTLTFNVIALIIALTVTRRWREHRLPACIQRHIPVYDPMSYYQSKATVGGVLRVIFLDMVPEYAGLLFASLTFGELVIAVLGLQLD